MVFKLKKKKIPMRDLNFEWKPIMTDKMRLEGDFLDKLIEVGKIDEDKVEELLDNYPDLEDLGSRLAHYVHRYIYNDIAAVAERYNALLEELQNRSMEQDISDQIQEQLGEVISLSRDLRELTSEIGYMGEIPEEDIKKAESAFASIVTRFEPEITSKVHDVIGDIRPEFADAKDRIDNISDDVDDIPQEEPEPEYDDALIEDDWLGQVY